MKYLVLLLISLIAALVWLYYEWVYPIPAELDDMAIDDVDFDADSHAQRLMIADECKRACCVAISFCAIIAAIMGASEW